MLRIAPTADCLWAGGSGASLVHDRFSPQRLTRSSVGTVNLDLKQIPEGSEPPWFSAWVQKNITIQHDRSASSMDTSVDKGPCKHRSPLPGRADGLRSVPLVRQPVQEDGGALEGIADEVAQRRKRDVRNVKAGGTNQDDHGDQQGVLVGHGAALADPKLPADPKLLNQTSHPNRKGSSAQSDPLLRLSG